MKCPKCASQKLTAAMVGDVQVDRCPHCQGLWFNPSELSTLLGETARHLQPLLKEKKVHAEENERPGDCPTCGQPMLRIRSPQNRTVTIDTCATCHGIWLDGGEFNALYRKHET